MPARREGVTHYTAIFTRNKNSHLYHRSISPLDPFGEEDLAIARASLPMVGSLTSLWSRNDPPAIRAWGASFAAPPGISALVPTVPVSPDPCRLPQQIRRSRETTKKAQEWPRLSPLIWGETILEPSADSTRQADTTMPAECVKPHQFLTLTSHRSSAGRSSSRVTKASQGE
jgi:hypothetical protein